jgi:hypothetical protein
MCPEKRMSQSICRKQKSNSHTKEFSSRDCHRKLISTRSVPLHELNFDDRPITHTEESNISMNTLIKYIDKEGFAKDRIVVAETPHKMVLLDGRRRVYAYRQLGKEFICAEVYKFRSEEDISTIRKIANSFRYLDKARLIHNYFNVKLTSRSLRNLISSLIEHHKHLEHSNGILADTVDATATLYGMQIGTVRNLLRLKRLPPRIQEALLNGTLGLSKAYLMARYHDREDLMDIFEQTIEQRLSKSALKRLLKADPHFVRCNLILGTLRAAIKNEVCLMGIDDVDSLVVETCDLLKMYSVYSRFGCIPSLQEIHFEEDI